MHVACGFTNGIGNYVIYSSALQALASISDNGQIDLALSEMRTQQESVRLMAKNSPFVRQVVNYPSEFNKDNYDAFFVSHHTLLHDPFFAYVHKENRFKKANYTNWAQSLIHEQTFYYMELKRQFRYRGEIFPQFVPISTTLPIELPTGPKIVIANGYQRITRDIWKRKSWPYFPQLLDLINDCRPDAYVFIVGGKVDAEWGKLILLCITGLI